MANNLPASPEWFRTLLSDPEATRLWLGGLGVRNPNRTLPHLREVAERVGGTRLLPELAAQLHNHLPRCPDAGMALTNLERFLDASRDQLETVRLLAESSRTTELLLQLFSTSQHLSELIIRDPSLLDWLRSGPERLDRDALVEDLWSTLHAAGSEHQERLALRRYRQREMLRIGYNDIVRGLTLETTTLDLSSLADACVEAACRLARARTEERHGSPMGRAGKPAAFVVLALGKLGGQELNYSSDIDLMFLYDHDGQTAGPRSISNAEFFAKMGGDIVRLLAEHTELGMAYRVDMRLRPEGDQGALARSLGSTLGYYETTGRTWERQALIKCRPIAGDLNLGRTFLDAITPFVYRRYLSAAEINEIKAMKRRIEQRTLSSGEADFEVKTGHGGIRDVEFVVQFLQLLHGGEYPDVRHANTLIGMSRLEDVGCLTPEERRIMEATYRFLRRLEHRLQIMFDRQTHQMPRDLEEQRTLAVRMGYPPATPWEDRTGPAQRFLSDYRAKTDLNRRILNHLLHDAFLDDGTTSDPVVDLVLDPHPRADLVASVLAKYPFRDRTTAHANLLALAREDIPFLSQARCRHFLAAIAPRMLEAVSRAPDPDMALTNLEKVSASLGAKGVLWELFSYNPPSLRLFVELCATSQFLSEILINNPGMIDDLMDSLVDDRSQPAQAIKAELAELCKGAQDLAPILLSFRNKEWVRIGTRDILGREPIRDVTRELADVAGAIVAQTARAQWEQRALRFGNPRRPGEGKKARWAIVALGKLGGRELNYHSDLDLVFLLEDEGMTSGGKGETPISNEQFATEVVHRLLKVLGGSSKSAPLYAVDTRLRPHGNSGPLVVTLDAFRRYFEGPAQTWERLALTRARVVFSSGGFGRTVSESIHEAQTRPVDRAMLARGVVAMRWKLEEAHARSDLKRGYGGIADIEFLVHYLQLAHASECPEVLRPNLWDALDALRRLGILAADAHADLREAYDFWRSVESRLRIVHNGGPSDLPESDEELTRLVRRLSYGVENTGACPMSFRADAARHAHRCRALFQEYVAGTTGE